MQKYVEEGLHFWIQTIYIYIYNTLYIYICYSMSMVVFINKYIYIYIYIHISFILIISSVANSMFHIWDPVFGMQEIIVGGGSTIVEPTIDSS